MLVLNELDEKYQKKLISIEEYRGILESEFKSYKEVKEYIREAQKSVFLESSEESTGDRDIKYYFARKGLFEYNRNYSHYFNNLQNNWIMFNKDKNYLSFQMLYFSKTRIGYDFLSVVPKNIITLLKNIPSAKESPKEFEKITNYVLAIEYKLEMMLDLDALADKIKNHEIMQDEYWGTLENIYRRLDYLKEYYSYASNSKFLSSKFQFLKSDTEDVPNLLLDTQSMLLYSSNNNFLNNDYSSIDSWEILKTPFSQFSSKESKKPLTLVSDFLHKTPHYLAFHAIYSEDKGNLKNIIPQNILKHLEDDRLGKEKLSKIKSLVKYLLKLERLLNINAPIQRFSYLTILNNNYSQINKHEIFIAFIDSTLEKIDNFVMNNAFLMQKSNTLYLDLYKKKTSNLHLLEIKNYLLKKFDISFDNLKDNFLALKMESIAYLDEGDDKHSIWEISEYASKEIDFNTLCDSVARRYNLLFDKIERFDEESLFLKALFQKVEEIFDYENKFSFEKKAKLLSILTEDYIEEKFEVIFAEWKMQNDKIIVLYHHFIQKYFNKQISQKSLFAIIDVLLITEEKLEDFFENVRSGIVMNYQNNPKKALLEEIDTENRIFEIYKNARTPFVEIIRDEENIDAKRVISQGLKTLIQIHFTQDDIFDSISNEFSLLAQKNVEIYLNDIEEYGKVLEKRDMEIGKLFFKMKKDLENNKDKK